MATPNVQASGILDRDEVLRFIIEKERLTKTLRHFGVDKAALHELLVPGAIAPMEEGSGTEGGEGSSEEPEGTSQSQKKSRKKSTKKSSANRSKTSASKMTEQRKKAQITEESSVDAAEPQEDNQAEEVPIEQTSARSGQQTNTTAEGGTMKSKSKANTSRKQSSGTATASEEENTLQQAASEEDTSNADDDELEDDDEDKGSRKGGRRRQSSPRGRRAVRFDPEDYVYNRLLIYTDGAARGNPGESGAGVVLKTPEGEEVGRFGRYLGRGTNNFAEYQALLLGLQHAQEFGASDITILSDSDLLVRQLCGEYRVRAAHLRVLFEEAQKMLALFEKYQIKRIEREKNREADSMANRAIDERL